MKSMVMMSAAFQMPKVVPGAPTPVSWLIGGNGGGDPGEPGGGVVGPAKSTGKLLTGENRKVSSRKRPTWRPPGGITLAVAEYWAEYRCVQVKSSAAPSRKR